MQLQFLQQAAILARHDSSGRVSSSFRRNCTYGQGENPVAHHPFCKCCGVHVFDRVDTPNATGYPYINVNIMCIEELDINEALNAPVIYQNGLQNDWSNPPSESRHL